MMNEKCTACGSCGFPMSKPEDYALGNKESPYCAHCTTEDGTLKPYQEIFEMTVQYYKSSQGISDAAARELVQEVLSSFPAWKKN
ncbi:MAG: zinc ribbon domain-containing protein [Candidatus Nucleicultricaceae bacterium]